MKSKLVIISCIFVSVICSCGNHSSTQKNIRFTNTILAGFYPDPSICSVDQDYYLVNSTFAYYPGIPVFHSRDLVNWKLIGHVMDRPEQLNLDGMGVSRGIFAPAIRYNQGIFYVTCTLVDGGGYSWDAGPIVRLIRISIIPAGKHFWHRLNGWMAGRSLIPVMSRSCTTIRILLNPQQKQPVINIAEISAAGMSSMRKR